MHFGSEQMDFLVVPSIFGRKAGHKAHARDPAYLAKP